MFLRILFAAWKYKRGCMFLVDRVYACGDIFIVKLENEIDILKQSINKLENVDVKFINKVLVRKSLEILKDCLLELEQALDYVNNPPL